MKKNRTYTHELFMHASMHGTRINFKTKKNRARIHTHAAYMYKKQLSSCSTLFGQAKRTNLLHYLRRRQVSLHLCFRPHRTPRT
jgi:hypothetical protein